LLQKNEQRAKDGEKMKKNENKVEKEMRDKVDFDDSENSNSNGIRAGVLIFFGLFLLTVKIQDVACVKPEVYTLGVYHRFMFVSILA
jgi:hypothetical protein